MPRTIRGFQDEARTINRNLVDRLAKEFKSNQESGQPMIDEQEFPTGNIRVNVIWDEWNRHSLEDRTATILRAYELAEGLAYREKIALASGLTVSEAHAAGMLPYQIIAARRSNDPVTTDQIRKAMLEEGASILVDPNNPQLRFATAEEAEACKKRLITRLPGSEQVWIINREIMDHDFVRAQEWAIVNGD